jgi:hypothetical protein
MPSVAAGRTPRHDTAPLVLQEIRKTRWVRRLRRDAAFAAARIRGGLRCLAAN